MNIEAILKYKKHIYTTLRDNCRNMVIDYPTKGYGSAIYNGVPEIMNLKSDLKEGDIPSIWIVAFSPEHSFNGLYIKTGVKDFDEAFPCVSSMLKSLSLTSQTDMPNGFVSESDKQEGFLRVFQTTDGLMIVVDPYDPMFTGSLIEDNLDSHLGRLLAKRIAAAFVNSLDETHITSLLWKQVNDLKTQIFIDYWVDNEVVVDEVRRLES